MPKINTGELSPLISVCLTCNALNPAFTSHIIQSDGPGQTRTLTVTTEEHYNNMYHLSHVALKWMVTSGPVGKMKKTITSVCFALDSKNIIQCDDDYVTVVMRI